MSKKSPFRILSVLLLMTLMTGLVGCSSSSPAPSASPAAPSAPANDKYGGTAVFRISGEPQTLTPLVANDLIANLINSVLNDQLVRLNTKGQYEGRLVKDWTVSPDGLTYTFNLRDNAKWHDGKPVTSDDVVFTHELIMNPAAGLPARTNQMINGKPIEYEKVTDKQFKVVLPEQFAPLLSRLITPIPKHVWEKVEPKDYKTSSVGQKPIMSGPFQFVEYKTGEYIKFKRFDDYWEGKPYLEGFIFQNIPDNNAATVALETGQVLFSDLSGDDYKRIKEAGKLQTYTNASGNVQLFVMNAAKAPFNDLRVRQAFSHLLDKDSIVSKAFLGYAEPANDFMVPTDMFYNKDVTVKYEFSVDKAKQLLAAAGFTPGANGILQKDGKPLEFDLALRAGNAQVEQAGIIIQSSFAKAGVKVNLRATDWSQLVATVTSNDRPRKFDTAIMGYTMGPEPASYSQIYGTAAESYVTYSNPKVDELFSQGERELDPAKRKAIYEQLQKQITADAAAGFLWYAQTLYGFSPKLKTEEAEITWLAHIRFLKPGKLYLTK